MPIKSSNMNRIFIVIFCVVSVIKANGQIYSSSVQGIDCTTPEGYIILDSISAIELIIWEFKDNNNWTHIDSFPSIRVNPDGDSLFTTECGLYKVNFYYDNGTNNDIDSFTVSCPVTIGQGQEPILCYGDSSGIIKRPVYGGVKFDPDSSIATNDSLTGDEYYVYKWYFADDSTGFNTMLLPDTTENLVGASAGWYKTIVADVVGCSDSIDFTEFKNPQKFRVDTSYFVKNNKCNGDTIASIILEVVGGKKIMQSNKYFYYLTLDNDTIAYSDSDSTSSNLIHSTPSGNMLDFYADTIKISNLAAGSYIFSAIDSNDCTMIDTINVQEPDAYVAFTSPDSSKCASDSVEFIIDSIIGGNQNITFNFLNYGNDTINVLAGDYDIIVKDSLFSCVDTISVSIYAQYEIVLHDTIQHVLCYGDSSGSITIDSITGGNSAYSVQWGGVFPNDSLSISLLSAGTYTAFIFDSLGCTLIHDFTVNQPDLIQANAIFYPPSCNGFSDGSIKIKPNGGVEPYSNYWLNGTGTVDSLYGLTSGIYSLVVSDSLFCVDTISLTLNEPEQIAFYFTNYDSTLLCRGEETTIDIAISGGTGPFNVQWNDGDTTIQRVLSAGIYSCQVSDVNGCTTPNNQIIISDPDPFSIQNEAFNNPTCNIGGDATVNTVGGTNPIQYIWSTGETSQSINSLWGSDYWVIATDSCGNSDTAYFNLIPFELVTELIYDITTYIGLIEINSTSTEGPFSFEWIDINGSIISTDSLTSNLCEGTYYVTTSDVSTNCSVTDTLIATYYLPNGIVDESTTTVFSDADLWGNPPYRYFWDNAEISAHANICSGSHWVEVTDADGCVVRSDFDIDPLLIALDPAEFIIECNIENLDVDITADATGGTAPYTYAWSNGSTGNLINLSLNPGNYTVTVMDNNACTEDTSFVIAAISADCVPNVFTPNGDNINDTWSLENTFLYSDSEIRIYGRYGKLLFQSVGYNIPWDGKNENGNDVPEGSYFYHIEIGHDFDVIKGSVTIFR